MLGAIIGDTVGSRFEFNNIKSKDFELVTKESHLTDDSIMTLAVCDILQNGYVYDKDKVIDTFKKWGRAYPNRGYGGIFYRWLFSDIRDSYNSYGNGAAMRISAVGWYGNSEEEVKTLSRLVTEVTHSHPEGLKGAEVTAMCIYYARIGKSKEFIKKYVEKYYNLDFDYEELRKNYYHGEEICQVTVPQAIFCFLISHDFEDCLRTTISIGGDCDTTSAISCAIAEAYYKHIDEDLISKVINKLPEETNGCNPKKVIYHFLGDRRYKLSKDIDITNNTMFCGHIRSNNDNKIIMFDYANNYQLLMDNIIYDFIPDLIGDTEDKLSMDLIEDGNFLGYIDTLIYNISDEYNAPLKVLRDLYFESQNLKDLDDFKSLINEINDIHEVVATQIIYLQPPLLLII